MSTLATNFIHRLQIEQNYQLLADVSAEGSVLPDEDRWIEALDREQDPEKQDEILLHYRRGLDYDADAEPAGRD